MRPDHDAAMSGGRVAQMIPRRRGGRLAALAELEAEGDEAMATSWRGDPVPVYARLVRRRRRLLGKEHAATLGGMERLALARARAGDSGAARRIAEEVVSIRSRVLGPGHPDTVAGGRLLAALRDPGESVPTDRVLLGLLLEVQRRTCDDDTRTIAVRAALALCLRAEGDLAAARVLERENLHLRRRAADSDPEAMWRTLNDLSVTLLESMRIDDSHLVMDAGTDFPRAIPWIASLQADDLEAARSLQQDEIEELERRPRRGAGGRELVNAHLDLADVRGALGERPDARRQVLAAARVGADPQVTYGVRWFATQVRLASALDAIGEGGTARRLRRESVDSFTTRFGADDVITDTVRMLLE